MNRPDWWAGCDRLHRWMMKRAQMRPYEVSDGIHLVMGLVGEAGEVANEVKKYMRSGYQDNDFVKKMRGELADVRIYLELVARWLDIDLDAAVVEKRAIVDRRWKKEGYR